MSPDEYRLVSWARRVESRKSCPDILRERIDGAAAEVLRYHPEVTKISLTGSYAAGEWIDVDTPEDFKEARKLKRGFVKMSDIDFITEPKVFNLFRFNGYKVHCVPAVYPGTRIVQWL